MGIGSITSSGAASQAAWVSQVQQQSGAGSAGPVHRPPPPPDGGALIGAVADALQSIGVTTTGAADDGSDTAASAETQGNAAQALGSFLHELMGALHEQGAAAQGGGQGGQPPDGQAYGPPGSGHGGPGGAGGPGAGPGRLAADLQSLISRLGSSSADDTETTDGTDGADSTEAAGTTDTTGGSATALESAFENLLQALGSDTSDAGSKLSSFLQTLADKLPGAGSSGNLINTSV